MGISFGAFITFFLLENLFDSRHSFWFPLWPTYAYTTRKRDISDSLAGGSTFWGLQTFTVRVGIHLMCWQRAAAEQGGMVVRRKGAFSLGEGGTGGRGEHREFWCWSPVGLFSAQSHFLELYLTIRPGGVFVVRCAMFLIFAWHDFAQRVVMEVLRSV